MKNTQSKAGNCLGRRTFLNADKKNQSKSVWMNENLISMIILTLGVSNWLCLVFYYRVLELK